MNKKCIGECNGILEENEEYFSFRKDTNKFRNECKICEANRKKDWQEKNKKRLKKDKKKYYNLYKKEWKKVHMQYYEINKQQILIQKRNYYNDNKEKILAKNKKYNGKNKEKIRYQKTKYMQFKLKTDIRYKIKGSLRSRINLALRGNSKSLSTMMLIGCEIDYLMYHIQEQFKSGMTWNNYGKGLNGKGLQEWSIDHKIPCARFDLSKPEEQLKCFHFTNLQPLWAEDNLRKGNKI